MTPRLRHVVLGLAVVLCCSASALAQETTADVAGTWKGTMETQMGPVENIITIQAGAPFTGDVKAGEFEGKIEKAKLDGNRISFQITIQYGTVAYEGTVSGDEMKLDVTGTTGNKMILVAKRQK
jgi:hypothetical protein